MTADEKIERQLVQPLALSSGTGWAMDNYAAVLDRLKLPHKWFSPLIAAERPYCEPCKPPGCPDAVSFIHSWLYRDEKWVGLLWRHGFGFPGGPSAGEAQLRVRVRQGKLKPCVEPVGLVTVLSGFNPNRPTPREGSYLLRVIWPLSFVTSLGPPAEYREWAWRLAGG